MLPSAAQSSGYFEPCPGIPCVSRRTSSRLLSLSNAQYVITDDVTIRVTSPAKGRGLGPPRQVELSCTNCVQVMRAPFVSVISRMALAAHAAIQWPRAACTASGLQWPTADDGNGPCRVQCIRPAMTQGRVQCIIPTMAQCRVHCIMPAKAQCSVHCFRPVISLGRANCIRPAMARQQFYLCGPVLPLWFGDYNSANVCPCACDIQEATNHGI